MSYRIYLHEGGKVGLAGQAATLESASIVAAGLCNIMAPFKGLPGVDRPAWLENNPRQRWGVFIKTYDPEFPDLDEIMAWLGDEPLVTAGLS